jgi:hypothetical protein
MGPWSRVQSVMQVPLSRSSGTARVRLPIVLVLATSAFGASLASAQSRLSEFEPPMPSIPAYPIGAAIGVLDDLDGDGVREVAVEASRVIRILSGRTGDVRVAVASVSSSSLDTTIAVLGDVDDDGFRDFAVGYSQHTSGGLAARGLVEVYSARTGRRLRTFVGDAAGWELGTSVTGVGDVDGDGVDDYAAGAPGRDTTGPGGGTDVGIVRLWSGATGVVLWQASFGGPFSRCGNSIAGLGDLDGDGSPSIAIASVGVEAVYVAEILGTTPVMTILSPDFGSEFGASIARIGDQDGDGKPDVAVGSPNARYSVCSSPFGLPCFPPPPPRAYGNVRIFGSVSGLELVDERGFVDTRIGRDLVDVGDIDGDGRSDVFAWGAGDAMFAPDRWVVVGVNGRLRDGQHDRSVAVAEDLDGDGLGDAWFASGSVSRHDSVFGFEQFSIAGPDIGRFGSAVAVLGDLDGDGRREVAVGGPHLEPSGATSQGLVQVWSQGVILYSLEGSAFEEFGFAIAGLGDLDADGVEDFVVGRPNALLGVGTRAGAVSVYSGATGTVLRQHFGQAFGDRFGASVARIPDCDGDGVDDYAVGSPGATSLAGFVGAGRVVVYSGASGAPLFDRGGALVGAAFGTAVAGIEDLDGDGRGDLLVGAPRGFSPGTRIVAAGSVMRYSGASGGLLGVVTGVQARMGYGAALASAGADHDGDGVHDYLVGAPDWRAPINGGEEGRYELCSGATGAAIHVENGGLGGRLGEAVAGAPDLDNDDVPDFLVGEPRGIASLQSSLRLGRVRLISGATRTWQRSFDGELDGERFGQAIATGVDLDGDRFADAIVGASRGAPAGTSSLSSGIARTWTGRTLGSEVVGTGTAGCYGDLDLTVLRPARPGAVMELRTTGVEAGGVPFLLAGSMADPVGLPLLGALLHVDPLIFLELPLVTGSPYVFQIPWPNDAALVGQSLYLQSLVFGPASCPARPFPLASSNGLVATFQP